MLRGPVQRVKPNPVCDCHYHCFHLPMTPRWLRPAMIYYRYVSVSALHALIANCRQLCCRTCLSLQSFLHTIRLCKIDKQVATVAYCSLHGRIHRGYGGRVPQISDKGKHQCKCPPPFWAQNITQASCTISTKCVYVSNFASALDVACSCIAYRPISIAHRRTPACQMKSSPETRDRRWSTGTYMYLSCRACVNCQLQTELLHDLSEVFSEQPVSATRVSWPG